jgi:hypothetical protein
MWAGGPINGTFFKWANKWYTYPISRENHLKRINFKSNERKG